MNRTTKLAPTPKSTNAVALTQDNQLQNNTQLQGLGFEIFGEQEFVRYPVIGVNQPTSDYKPEGKFHNRVTGDTYDTVEVIFLGLRRSMTFRPNGYSDAVPACFSNNALQPDASVEQPVHHTCHRLGPRGLIAECPNARWNRNSEGKARRSCDLRYTAAVDFEGKHYLMYFQGRSIAPLERFLSQVRQFRQPLFGVRASLSLIYRTKKEGFMGNFYETSFPDLSNPSERERIEIVDALQYQDMAQFFKEYFETAPSDLYHEGEEDEKNTAPTKEGVRHNSEKREGASIDDRWGNANNDF